MTHFGYRETSYLISWGKIRGFVALTLKADIYFDLFLLVIGTLRSNDADDNENVKKKQLV